MSVDAHKKTQLYNTDRIRKLWPDFSENDLLAISNNELELKERLKRVYGFTDERAESEYRTFMKPFESSFEPTH